MRLFQTSSEFVRRAVWLPTALLLFVVGCGSPVDPARSVEDDLGRTIHLPDTIGRVVTLAPALTEIVFAAGAGHKIVGVGRPDDFPPQIDTLPRYNTYPLDFEAVASLDPDVALASDQVNGMRDAEALHSLDIPTYFLASNSLDEIFGGIEDVARLLGTERAGKRTADSLRQEVTELRTRVRGAARPLTLVLIGQETLFSFGRESYMHELIELAGGRSATGDLDATAPVLSEEFVLSIKPDVIIGSWGEDFDAARLLDYHPTWNVLPAVENGRVYGVNPDLLERPGPRLVEGAWAMARRIHPDLFDGR